MTKSARSLILALLMLFGFGCMTAPQAQAAELSAHSDHCVCGGLYDGQTTSAHTCSQVTGWTELTLSLLSSQSYNLQSGNYYLSGDLSLAKRIFPAAGSNVTICLNGFSLTSSGSTGTDGRVLNANRGNTVLNICDCKGSGQIASTATNCHGGLIQIGASVSTAQVNLYGGTLIGNTLSGEYNGGAVYHVAGTFNMHGGVIQGGNTGGAGGNVYSSGTFNLYGGTIQDGIASGRGGNIATSGTLNMHGGLISGGRSSIAGGNIGQTSTSAVMNLTGGVIQGGCSTASHGGNLAIYGKLNMSGGTVTQGTAYAKGGNIFVNGTVTITGGAVSQGSDSIGAGIWVNAGKKYTPGGNITSAVYVTDTQTLTLHSNLNAQLKLGNSVNSDMIIDLNGYDLSGSIAGAYKVYGMDSATKDFTGANYGTLSSSIHADTTLITTTAQADFNGDLQHIYIPVREATGWSFHAVYLGISDTDVEVDANGNVGVRYTTYIKASPKVAHLITGDNAYGLKIYLQESNAQSAGMAAGSFMAGPMGNAVTVYLADIMTAGGQINAARALAPINAKAYVVIDGTIIESEVQSFTLRQILEALDQNFDLLSAARQQVLVEIYERYTADMRNWEIPNIKDVAGLPEITITQEQEDALRQQVLDYMYQLSTVQWKPSKNMTLICGCGKHNRNCVSTTTYSGMPYAHDAASLEKFRYFVTNGIIDVDNMDMHALGNDCADAVYWAWSQISSSISFTLTDNAVCENGILPVGNYIYQGLDTTGQICDANTQAVMFAAYAQLKPGDAVVSNTRGHIMMVAQVNTETNTVILYEQGDEDGNAATFCSISTQYTFAELLNEDYIPITMAAFTQGADTEQVFACNAADANLWEMVESGYVVSNYRINYVTLTITQGNTTVATFTQFPYSGNTSNGNVVNLSVFQDAVNALELTAAEQYTYEILVHVGDTDVIAQTVTFTA